MDKATEQARRDWERLGDRDPLWAVLVRPGTKNGRWAAADFLATGRAEVDASLAHLASLGVRLGPGPALDFGCGAGRLTQALAAHVETVIGIDVSAAMLATAAELDVTEGRCRFVRNEDEDLRRFGDGTFDLVYTSLVLQHLPPTQGREMLAELARVTAPGGALVVQVPTALIPSPKALVLRHAPWPVIRFLQRAVLGYPAPMRMHPFTEEEVVGILGRHGVDVLDRVEDTTNGGDWTYHRYFAVKRQ